jgi:hypothetical protein
VGEVGRGEGGGWALRAGWALEAAVAYDIAGVELRGPGAKRNFQDFRVDTLIDMPTIATGVVHLPVAFHLKCLSSAMQHVYNMQQQEHWGGTSVQRRLRRP